MGWGRGGRSGGDIFSSFISFHRRWLDIFVLNVLEQGVYRVCANFQFKKSTGDVTIPVFREVLWSPFFVYSSSTMSFEQLIKQLLVVTCCVVDTETVRFGDETRRKLTLTTWSTAVLTIWLMFLAIGEPVEKQVGFLSCAVVAAVVIWVLVVETNKTSVSLNSDEFGQLSVSKTMMYKKKVL